MRDLSFLYYIYIWISIFENHNLIRAENLPFLFRHNKPMVSVEKLFFLVEQLQLILICDWTYVIL